MKVAVMTDSTAYIPADLREQLGIHMVPLNVVFGNESYREEVDLETEDFYSMVNQAEALPKTSQPSIGLITEKLEQLSKNYDAVVSIHLSSGISGTFQSVLSAARMVDGIDVYAFDSEISAMPQGYYALEAAELANNGQTAEQIIARLNEMKQSMNAILMVDDLSHLRRGGRLSGAQALVGSMLQVKPLLHFDNKVIVPLEKVRTHKKAVKRMETLFGEVAETGKAIRAVVIHANRLAEAEQIKQRIEEQYDNVEVTISYFGPVVGTHLGEGALGLGWYVR